MTASATSATSAVIPRFLSFIDALRRSGVRAAEGEVIDAMRSLDALGAGALADADTLRALLSTTLAKSANDEDTLARVFALHFGALPLPAWTPLDLEAALVRAGLDAEQARRVVDGLTDDDALTAALLAGDSGRAADLLRQALEDTDLDGLGSALQLAYFAQRLLSRLDVAGLDGRVARLRVGLAPDAERALTATAAAIEERARRAARRAVETELEKRTQAKPQRSGALLHRDLRHVDDGDRQALRALVRRLAQRLRARLAQRRRRTRRGRLDARATLRASVATDAVPMRVKFVRKRPARPALLVLCDVSDSVRQASLFMLELVAAIGDELFRSRSFVFVDRAGEVTALFRGDRDAAIAAVLASDVVPVGANSDYGKTLRGFLEAHGPAITRRTTLVILGDGRSNYRAPEAWALEEMRKRARRVLWLCPEDRGTWGFGDSEMTRYARHADWIFVVRTAADLARAIDRIAR